MKYIAIEEFSRHHGIEVTLIREFADFGLMALIVEDNREFVSDADVKQLERMLRLTQDLGINKEGIEVILNMRKELKKLRRKRKTLRYRLSQLEADHHRLVNPPFATSIIVDYSDNVNYPEPE